MLIVTIQVNAPPGSAECVKEVLGMALEQLGDARVLYWMPLPTPPECRPPEK